MQVKFQKLRFFDVLFYIFFFTFRKTNIQKPTKKKNNKLIDFIFIAASFSLGQFVYLFLIKF
jgi:hypothetical protein